MRWLVLVSLLAVLSCQKKEKHEASHGHDIVVDEIPEDIRIPSKLWDEITGSTLAEDAAKVDDEGTNKSLILFSPVTVVLKEHNPEVLDRSEIRIALPRGGGEIDISQYIGTHPGSFYVKFEYPEEWAAVKDVKGYFVSRAKKRKLDNEIYGAGCNRYMEITGRLNRENSTTGIKVNTTRDRHTSVLGGHFIFAAKKEHQTFLSQVTFVDSKNMHFFCEKTKVL